MISSWPGPDGEELAVALDRSRERRVLVLPALFDEANKLRHFTVEVMRLLDTAGIDTFLPDLPGCNESLALLDRQTLGGWRDAAALAARHFGATQVLTFRGGALTFCWMSIPWANPSCCTGWPSSPSLSRCSRPG